VGWAREEGERVLAAAGVPVISQEDDDARRGDLLDTSQMQVEADYLNGEISMLGRLHGVPTPVNDLQAPPKSG
jgi:2-dehydropantoate 2-reductase